MTITVCDVPPNSALDQDVVARAYFRDSYRAPLVRRELGIVDVFFAVFGYKPLYVKILLVIRNVIARFAGLDVPSVRDIMAPKVLDAYSAGDRIGPWPVFSITDSEIIAGRNNKHLDFRLSVLKQADPTAASVTVSTICTVHNMAGKVYLFFVVPFHRLGVKMLMRHAVAAKRL